MTTGERLVDISTLSTGSAMNHFLNIANFGEGVVVNRIYNNYKIRYVGRSSNLVQYVKPLKAVVRYISEKKVFRVEYIAPRESSVAYIEPKKIKIILICKV